MALFGVDGVLMVDENRQTAEQTLKAIRSFTSARQSLVNTHVHPDHTGANGSSRSRAR